MRLQSRRKKADAHRGGEKVNDDDEDGRNEEEFEPLFRLNGLGHDVNFWSGHSLLRSFDDTAGILTTVRNHWSRNTKVV